MDISSVLYKLFNICAINTAGNEKELGLYSEGDSLHTLKIHHYS